MDLNNAQTSAMLTREMTMTTTKILEFFANFLDARLDISKQRQMAKSLEIAKDNGYNSVVMVDTKDVEFMTDYLENHFGFETVKINEFGEKNGLDQSFIALKTTEDTYRKVAKERLADEHGLYEVIVPEIKDDMSDAQKNSIKELKRLERDYNDNLEKTLDEVRTEFKNPNVVNSYIQKQLAEIAVQAKNGVFEQENILTEEALGYKAYSETGFQKSVAREYIYISPKSNLTNAEKYEKARDTFSEINNYLRKNGTPVSFATELEMIPMVNPVPVKKPLKIDKNGNAIEDENGEKWAKDENGHYIYLKDSEGITLYETKTGKYIKDSEGNISYDKSNGEQVLESEMVYRAKISFLNKDIDTASRILNKLRHTDTAKKMVRDNLWKELELRFKDLATKHKVVVNGVEKEVPMGKDEYMAISLGKYLVRVKSGDLEDGNFKESMQIFKYHSGAVNKEYSKATGEDKKDLYSGYINAVTGKAIAFDENGDLVEIDRQIEAPQDINRAYKIMENYFKYDIDKRGIGEKLLTKAQKQKIMRYLEDSMVALKPNFNENEYFSNDDVNPFSVFDKVISLHPNGEKPINVKNMPEKTFQNFKNEMYRKLKIEVDDYEFRPNEPLDIVEVYANEELGLNFENIENEKEYFAAQAKKYEQYSKPCFETAKEFKDDFAKHCIERIDGRLKDLGPLRKDIVELFDDLSAKKYENVPIEKAIKDIQEKLQYNRMVSKDIKDDCAKIIEEVGTELIDKKIADMEVIINPESKEKKKDDKDIKEVNEYKDVTLMTKGEFDYEQNCKKEDMTFETAPKKDSAKKEQNKKEFEAESVSFAMQKGQVKAEKDIQNKKAKEREKSKDKSQDTEIENDISGFDER